MARAKGALSEVSGYREQRGSEDSLAAALAWQQVLNAHMVAGDRNDVFTGAVVDFLDRHRPQDSR